MIYWVDSTAPASRGRTPPCLLLNWVASSISSKRETFQVKGMHCCVFAASSELHRYSGKIGKDVLDLMFNGDKRMGDDIISEKGWKQVMHT